MAVISSGAGSVSTTPAGGYGTGVVLRPVITLADTEQALSLPAGTKAFMLKNVGSVAIRCAYTSGGTLANYFTISPNSFKWMTDLDGTARVLYVRSSKASHQLELEYWL